MECRCEQFVHNKLDKNNTNTKHMHVLQPSSHEGNNLCCQAITFMRHSFQDTFVPITEVVHAVQVYTHSQYTILQSNHTSSIKVWHKASTNTNYERYMYMCIGSQCSRCGVITVQNKAFVTHLLNKVHVHVGLHYSSTGSD